LALAEKLKDREERREAMGSVLGAWARTDLNGVMSYLARLPEGQEKRNLLQNVASSAASQAPAEAYKIISQSNLGGSRQWILADIFRQWSRKDPMTAIQTMLTETPQAQKRTICHSIAMGWAETDPNAAFQWAMGLKDAGQRNQAVMGILNSVEECQPDQVVSIYNGLTDKRLKADVASTVARV